METPILKIDNLSRAFSFGGRDYSVLKKINLCFVSEVLFSCRKIWFREIDTAESHRRHFKAVSRSRSLQE
jgi:hypothetical protein